MCRIIPRFLYHITSKANYEKILEAGKLKPSHDNFFGDGVFCIELNNFFKRWKKSNSWEFDSLQEELIKQAAKGESGLVMLKIPTEKLSWDNLKIRSQNRLFGNVNMRKEIKAQKYEKMNEYISDEIQKIRKLNLSEEEKKLKEKEFYKYLDAKFAPLLNDKAIESQIPGFSHVYKGATAKERKLYQRRKEAIEYIYPDNIPAGQIEKIGEINLDILKEAKGYDSLKPIRSIFSAMLKGSPQEKGALMLNC